MRICWCGAENLSAFNQDYSVCPECGTLVSQQSLTDEQLLVQNDETDFYGKQYWLEHQKQDLGFSDIYSRSRSDLTERNLHWLKTLLTYCLPPAAVLEVGCSHGSFVALLRQAGYDATGVEMSPWVVELGQKTFAVPISVGPVENLDIPHGSLDAIVLFDVLEHLPAPVATLAQCLKLLKPEGLMLVQTPQFREGMEHAVLVETKDRFLEILKADEHLYLFSERSVGRLFHDLGVEHLHYEPAIFAHYDMFFVASRSPFTVHSRQDCEQRLLDTPNGRLAQALMDLRDRELELEERLSGAEADSCARLHDIESLTRLLEESEADRHARWEQIQTLTRLLEESEADRQSKGLQIEQLTFQLEKVSRILARRFLSYCSKLMSLLACITVRLAELVKKSNSVQKKMCKKSLKTIAVDLTPVLPGGENGGAKVFVLELLRRLAVLAPETQFILLTQAASHQELAEMDCANISRRLVLGQTAVAQTVRPRMRGLARLILPLLPARVQRIAGGLGYRLQSHLKRGGSSSLLSELGADLLFCPFTAPIYYETGIPTVCTIYDLQYKTYPEFFAPEDVAHRDRTFVEACRHAAALTAISDYSRETALQHGQLASDRIRTIYLRMAQRVASVPGEGADVLKQRGVEAGRYLIYPANFWRHKNHEMLFTAFGMACQAGLAGDIKLVCTGAPGERQEYLARAVTGMGLGDRIVFPGYIPSAELAALLAHARGMVFPSLYEGFGLPVIEAMAAGVPVACSNATSLPEVAAGATILFDPRVPTQIADAMVSLFGDDARRDNLIEAGRRRAAEFSDSGRMAREYWDLFLYAMDNVQQGK